jgi:phosphoribosylformylglycinamidine synthase subunit PurL
MVTDAEIKVTVEIAKEHGLTAEEYARTQKILGRDPSLTELGIFSVMWSEHCSYKSSRAHLKKLPTRGAHVVQGPGENAGVVDIGDGMVAVFKIESHNHPSFVEPFQGAATGVGGILRDIFTMGARPIAVLDSLRFGPVVGRSEQAVAREAGEEFLPDGPAGLRPPSVLRNGKSQVDRELSPQEVARNRRILDGVVRGIGFYGNCFGVPTVGGEVAFEPCYSNNPLVNALALGIARREELFFARARGAGNPAIYVGAKTGRDGIHGASLLASAEFSQESQQKRPNVQVGDPFMEKLLLEACLEAMRTGAIVAIQDMGAAGLTSSSAEMASRGRTGIEIELARVPQRETGMTPYEVMLSESQERMLLVAERGRERQVFDVFHKWGLDAVEVGRVTDDGKLRVLHHGRVVAEIPAHALAEECPRYERPIAAPTPEAPPSDRLVEFAAAGTDLTENFCRLLASPTIASKEWVTKQYDSMVRTNTRMGPGAADAAVLRLKESKRGLAIKTDGNGRWCQLAPRLGAMHAAAEAARNVACTGARPIAATNCLNFGNPEKPEVMWQFTQAIEGVAEACRALETPITGGNVSFYNETLGNAIYPTPILGVLGLIEDAECALGSAFRKEGDVIVLLDGRASGATAQEKVEGETSEPVRDAQSELKLRPPTSPSTGHDEGFLADRQAGFGEPRSPQDDEREFSSSEYAKTIHGVVAGVPPAIDLGAEKRLIECLVRLASEKAISSAHDVSDGGLAVTIAESCFGSAGLSAEVKLDRADAHAEAEIFGERGAQVVVSVSPASLARVSEIAAQYSVKARQIGSVTRGEFRIEYGGSPVIKGNVGVLHRIWSESLEKAIESA